MKPLALAHVLLKPCRLTSPCYLFSKNLKRKLEKQAQNQQKLGENPIDQLQRIEAITGKLTYAQKRGLDMKTQFAPLALLMMNGLAFSVEPFGDVFQWSLFGADKLTTLLLLTNINYPSNTYLKYTIIGAVIATNCIPIFHIVLQLLLVISFDSKKIKQNTQLSSQLKVLLEERLKNKLALYFALVFVLTMKGIYYYEKFRMEKLIEQFNLINRANLVPVIVEPKTQSQAQSKFLGLF